MVLYAHVTAKGTRSVEQAQAARMTFFLLPLPLPPERTTRRPEAAAPPTRPAAPHAIPGTSGRPANPGRAATSDRPPVFVPDSGTTAEAAVPANGPGATPAPGLADRSMQDAARIDKETRKQENKPLYAHPPPSLQSKFDKAFSSSVKPPAGSMENLVLPDGRRMTKVHSAWGTYCVEIKESARGERATMVTNCPE
jgi:hypothetical protein